MASTPINLLFICSRNQWRSPTAERVFGNRPLISARSAGTASSARHRVTKDEIRWADMILVMEDKHLKRLRADFPAAIKGKECHVLHVPDEFRYMDQALIDLLLELVDPILSSRR